MNILDEIRDSFKTGNTLTKLIYVNLAVFITIQAAKIIMHLFGLGDHLNTILDFLSVPTYLPDLIRKPWTIITYMFTHYGFMHILFNLLWLYWFGKIFLSYLSEKQLLSVYLLGGISGAFLYILSYNIFPGLSNQVQVSQAIGASASVMAIVIAISVLVPDYKVYVMLVGPVKIIYVALVAFALSSLIDFTVNTGGKIAHIGGAAFGYLYTYRYNRGKDISVSFSKFTDRFLSIFRRRTKMKVTHKKPMTDEEYNRKKVGNQKELDRILDKISKKGYDSLSKDEKEILFKMGGR